MSVEFKLDFSYAVPQNYLPTYKKATSAYTQTVPKAPTKIGFRQGQKRGVYLITVDAGEAAKLQGKSVTYSYGPREQYSVKVKLERQAAFIFRTNPKAVYIDWTQDSGLRYASNASLDKWLSEKVTIITGCEDDEDRDTGFKNGRKKAYVDFNKGQEIERFDWIECSVAVSGEAYQTAKGKVKITYKDQPVFCRPCATTHVGRCPVREKQEVERQAAELERAALVKTLIIGDSNLRHVDEIGTTARVCSSTGAKIGHTANALKFKQPEKYENVIIHAGANNISMKPVASMPEWTAQLDREVKQLAEQISTLDSQNIQTVLIAVPKSELSTTSKQTERMRTIINKELNSIATTHNHVQVINLDDDMNGEIEAWADYRHYSEIFCGKMLEQINTTLDEQLLRRGKAATTPRKYGRVNTSYRLGCGYCTEMDHNEDTCPRSANSTASSTKRGPPSGSKSPPTKKL